jgi:hypothetical protein
MARRLSGPGRDLRPVESPRSVCQVTELEGLAENLARRYTYCVPGAERMRPFLAAGLGCTTPRLVDARSGNKDISGKSRRWTVAGAVSGREPSCAGLEKPAAGIMQDDPWGSKQGGGGLKRERPRRSRQGCSRHIERKPFQEPGIEIAGRLSCSDCSSRGLCQGASREAASREHPSEPSKELLARKS